MFQGIAAKMVVIPGKFFRGGGLCVLWVLFLVSVLWGSCLFLWVPSLFCWGVILCSWGSCSVRVLGSGSWFRRYL